MKKVLFLFLALGVGKLCAQSNVSPFPEDFGSGTSYPGSFDSNNSSNSSYSLDWIIDDASSAPGIPVCNVGGSSGGSKLFGANSSSGVFEEVRTMPISTNTFVNVKVSWNALKANSSSPAVGFDWSNDNGATWNNIAYTNTSGTNTWGVISTINLPVAASGTIIVLRWYYTSTGTGGTDYVAIDDVQVTGTPSPAFYWDGTNPLHLLTSWGMNTNGSGTNPASFTIDNQNFFIQNATTATLTAAWTVSGTSTFLNIGDGTTGNKCNLIIPSSFALTMGGAAVLNVTNNSTLTIQNTTFPSVANIALSSPSSLVDFAQSSNVTLWATTFPNLTLSGTGTKSQPTGNLTVSGNFTIGASSSYVMVSSATRITRLAGAILCNGSITTANSKLTIDGSGSIGTLNFSGGTSINDFTLNRANQVMTLGTDFGVGGATALTNGGISLNGKLLTLSGAITFPAAASNGSITGSSTSSLTINGSGTISNNLFLGQANAAARTLNAFVVNRTSPATPTITMGNDMIFNTASFTNGNFAFNDKALTLSSTINFPASSSNGVFIGSTSSTLSIGGGANPLNNSFFMSQASTAAKTLGQLITNRATTTLTLGSDLIVGTSASFPNSAIDLNGKLLTLSGTIAFPTSPLGGRGFVGSNTSSITINGSGAITGSLVMTPGTTTSKILNSLVLNRSTQTVVISANTLETYGEILVSAGTINAGSGYLYIRSNATNKGRIGPVAGSITGNIKVETFALGGTTDWANLGPSGVDGLTVASWEGQIPMSCISCPNSPNSTGGVYFVSIQGWDPLAAASSTAAYLPLSYTSTLGVGSGYWTYLGTATGTTSDISWNVTGPAVQGDVAVELKTAVPSSVLDGFNLISNPYPSAISWSTALAQSPGSTPVVDDAIYVYNADVSGGTTSYAGGVSSDPAGITNTIPMGQGFYVQAYNSYTFTFKESNKIANNAPLLRSSNTTDAGIGTVMRLKVEDANNYDMTAIRFHGDATPAFDHRLDARKLFSAPGYVGAPGNQRTTISTKSGSEDYSINSLPNATTEDAVIPVLVKVKATGQHTISGTDLQNLPNSCVILKDKLTNTTQDLKVGPYVCNINASESTPRFELRVCADITMSVDEKSAAAQNVFISQDANGVFVKLNYDKATKSTISVTNILGQKVIENKSVTVDKDVVYLNIPEKNQLLFVTVTSENNKVTKKIVR